MSGLLHAHSGLRWAALIVLIASVAISLSRWLKGSNENSSKGIFTINVALIHIQALTGYILYFMSDKVQFSQLTMKMEIFRFFTLEHPLMMLIAVILITIGNAKAKRIEGVKKFKTLFIFNAISLIIILAMIPWPYKNLGAGWF